MTFSRLILLVIVALGASWSNTTPLFGQDRETGLDYLVELDDALNHYVTVTMTAMPAGEQTQIMMATWTPGSYLVREYARHLDRVTATDSQGNPLPIEKISKNRWVVTTPETDKPFSVSYRVFCDELSVRSNFVERSYAVLNGAPTFVTIPEQMDLPHRVQLKMPARWKRSATSLPNIGDDPDHFRAENFDELVDSPIVAGNVELFPFVVAGVEHYLVNINDRGAWDGDRAARDLAKIVETQQKVWGIVPYNRYLFLNVIGGGGGGLEHDNCCLIMSSRNAMREDNNYQRWLGLASHEFFHTWNVRRLRPKSLVHYDYEAEVYTPSLWVAEGVTSYYEDLMLVRAGLMEPADFLDSMGRQIRQLQNSQGRHEQSLRDSSHDAWIKFYRQSSNSDDTQISYYTKGAVVAMLLDARIRAATKGAKSLDDVLRDLYQNHAGDVGYQPEDFRRICSDVAGTNLDDWFATAVDSTNELDYQELADWFGLEVGDVLPTGAEVVSGENDNADESKRKKPTRWIGIGESGSPATRAGLSDDDEIIAVNGLRLAGNLNSRLQEFEIGDPIELLIARDGEIMEVLLAIGEKPAVPNWGLKISKQRSDEQTARLDALAGVVPPAVADAGTGDSDEPASPLAEPETARVGESQPPQGNGDGGGSR